MRLPIDDEEGSDGGEFEAVEKAARGGKRKGKPANRQREALLGAVIGTLNANGFEHAPLGESRHFPLSKRNFLKLAAIAASRSIEVPKRDPSAQRKVLRGLLAELVGIHSTKKLVVKVAPHSVTQGNREIHSAVISIKAHR